MLAAALAALQAGDAARALRLAVGAWVEAPDDVLGDAIVALGPRAARGVPAPSGDTTDERARTWTAAAAAGDPCVVHHLLHPGSEVALAQVGPPDPRVARAIADRLAMARLPRGPLSSIDREIKRVWTPVTAYLVAARDGRALATLVGAVGTIVGRVAPARRADATARAEAMIAEVRAACEAAPRRDDGALAAELLALATRPTSHDHADAAIATSLLADIHDAPDDDGPRAVYADWLIERGDPRGELIALQLAGELQRDRIAQLLHAHQAAWLGVLAPHVASAKFARGFVATCTIARGATPPPDRAWSTVTEIAAGLPATDACPMPALRIARDLSTADLARLAALAEPPPLQFLGWRDGPWREAAASYVAVAPRLPHLRQLAWHTWATIHERVPPDQLAWAWQTRALDQLDVIAHPSAWAAWYAAIEASALPVLILHDAVPLPYGYRTQLRLARDPTGAWGHLRIDAAHGTNTERLSALLDALVPLLDRMPRLAQFELTVPAASAWSATNRRRLDAALARHPELAVRTIPAFAGIASKKR